MARGYDEPFTLYGLIARTVETDAERSYVTFTLDPAARFSDGKPVTPEDVIFSWQLLRDKGRPNHRTYYAKVAKAEAVGERAVRFDLAGSDDRELPLILGLMPVLAKHAVKPDTFEETTFEPPLGSGPYVVGEVDPGKSVTLKRNPDYWGRDLADQPRLLEFRRDPLRFLSRRQFPSRGVQGRPLRRARRSTIRRAGRPATISPRVRDGRVVKDVLPTGLPKASSYFVFNTRRPVFADIRVREAISLLFDFEWINTSYFFDLYRRTASYFDGLRAVRARPAGGRARARAAGAISRTRCAPT